MTPIIIRAKFWNAIKPAAIVAFSIFVFFSVPAFLERSHGNQLISLKHLIAVGAGFVTVAVGLMLGAFMVLWATTMTIKSEGVKQRIGPILPWGSFAIYPLKNLFGFNGLLLRAEKMKIYINQDFKNFDKAVEIFREKGLLPPGEIQYEPWEKYFSKQGDILTRGLAKVVLKVKGRG